MSCELPNVPEYLHWNDRPFYTDADFLPKHHFYRLTLNGNPIEFPSGTITAYSCKWSILISEEDLFKVDNPSVGNTFSYAIISTIRRYELRNEKKEGNHIVGHHKLVCTLLHKPNECDYSHCEINIRHQIFSDVGEIIPSFDQIYTYEIWQAKAALLQGDNKFFKNLRKDYRKDMIKIFCLPHVPVL